MPFATTPDTTMLQTLTSTLNLDGTPDSDEYSPDYKVGHCFRALWLRIGHARSALQPTLLDEYEYGMCGKIFKYDVRGCRQGPDAGAPQCPPPLPPTPLVTSAPVTSAVH